MKTIATLLLPFLCNLAFACPDLTGTYSCPAWKKQKPLELTVKQTVNGDVTTYTHTYSTGHVSVTKAAKVAVVNPNGSIGLCDEKNYIHSKKEAPQKKTFNFINKDGNYSASVDGEIVIVCPRQ